MIGGLSMAVSMLGDVFGKDKSKDATGVGGAGFDISQLLGGKSDVTEEGVNASDKVSAGTQEALGMLREMTSGGIAGYFKWMVKQLKEKLMGEMGVTEESLAAMPAAQRDAIMDKIEEKIKEEVAKIMGVDPETAGKMMAASEKGTSVVELMEAKKAYKEEVPTV